MTELLNDFLTGSAAWGVLLTLLLLRWVRSSTG